jgi:hypothetical protein
MRKKYFGEEGVFERIWNDADRDGIWEGDAQTLAQEFSVPEDEAYATLSELCDRGLIQKLEPAKFIIVQWCERDDPGDES